MSEDALSSEFLIPFGKAKIMREGKVDNLHFIAYHDSRPTGIIFKYDFETKP
jgi:pyruvate/2-oxoglutarate/acetoin dehydrogenase E1 component